MLAVFRSAKLMRLESGHRWLLARHQLRQQARRPQVVGETAAEEAEVADPCGADFRGRDALHGFRCRAVEAMQGFGVARRHHFVVAEGQRGQGCAHRREGLAYGLALDTDQVVRMQAPAPPLRHRHPALVRLTAAVATAVLAGAAMMLALAASDAFPGT